MRRPLAGLLLAAALLAPALAAQGGAGPRQWAAAERLTLTMNYLIHLPAGYGADDRSRWPLLLFLHGAGEMGEDLERLKAHGPPRLIEAGADLPFIVVSPQVRTFGWDPATLGQLLDALERRYRVDPDRISVTGLSMGGHGTWALAAADPGRFAAIVPICGQGRPQTAAALRDLPVWAFHGARDTVVPPEGSAAMVRALEAQGARQVRFTLYDDAGHDSWTRAYDDPALWQWLARQRRGRQGDTP